VAGNIDIDKLCAVSRLYSASLHENSLKSQSSLVCSDVCGAVARLTC
jgi:hypothetical protein